MIDKGKAIRAAVRETLGLPEVDLKHALRSTALSGDHAYAVMQGSDPRIKDLAVVAVEKLLARKRRDAKLPFEMRSDTQLSVAAMRERVLDPVIRNALSIMAERAAAKTSDPEAFLAELNGPHQDRAFAKLIDTGLRLAGFKMPEGGSARFVISDEPATFEVDLHGTKVNVPVRRLLSTVFDHHGDYAAVPNPPSPIGDMLRTTEELAGARAPIIARALRQWNPADVRNDGPWARFIRATASRLSESPSARAEVASASARVNSTMRIIARFREIMGDTHEYRRSFDRRVQQAEAELGRVSTTNLGDGAWSVWVSRNLARLAKNPDLLTRIESIQQLEDFDLFRGPSFFENWKIAGESVYESRTVELQLAVLDMYDTQLAKHGVRGTDRINQLPEDVQAAILNAVMKRMDDAIDSSVAAKRHADRFRSSVRMIVDEAQQVVQPGGDRFLVLDNDVLQASVVERLREAGEENPAYPVFADWVAGAEALSKAAATARADGRDIGAFLRVGSIAIPGSPQGRTFVASTNAGAGKSIEVGPLAAKLRDLGNAELVAVARKAGAVQPESIPAAADLLAAANSRADIDALAQNPVVQAAQRALAVAGYTTLTHPADMKAFLNAVGQRGNALVFRFPGPGGGTPLDKATIAEALQSLT